MLYKQSDIIPLRLVVTASFNTDIYCPASKNQVLKVKSQFVDHLHIKVTIGHQ